MSVTDMFGLDDLNLTSFEGNVFMHLGRQAFSSSDASEQALLDTLFHVATPGTVFENIATGSGDDLIYGSNNRNVISLGEGDDVAFGFGGNDHIDGGDGDDRLLGGDGNDLLRGRNGVDRIAGQDGNDTVDGGAGDDFLSGGAGDDFIIGGTGNDFMSGGEGNDRLVGGAGLDKMRGGEGNDSFYFGDLTFSTDAQRDLILDFTVGEDKINLTSASPDITSLADLEIVDVTNTGSVVDVNHVASDFSFRVYFEGSDFDISATDFVFDPAFAVAVPDVPDVA